MCKVFLLKREEVDMMKIVRVSTTLLLENLWSPRLFKNLLIKKTIKARNWAAFWAIAKMKARYCRILALIGLVLKTTSKMSRCLMLWTQVSWMTKYSFNKILITMRSILKIIRRRRSKEWTLGNVVAFTLYYTVSSSSLTPQQVSIKPV